MWNPSGSTTTSSTFNLSLTPSLLGPTNGSSYMTSPSETLWEGVKRPCLPNATDSRTSPPRSLCLTESNTPPLQRPKRWEQEPLVLRPQVKQKSATSSIPMRDALTHPANIVTPAKAVERRDMVATSAQMGMSSEGGMQPKYL